jgi:hypothetical protein
MTKTTKTFETYLLEMLPLVFRNDESDKRFAAFGAELDKLKEAIFRLRLLWFSQWTDPSLIELFAESRGIKKEINETETDFQKRVFNAFDYYAMGGTRPGVEAAIKRVTNIPSYIHEYARQGWKLGNSKLGTNTTISDTASAFRFGVFFAESLSTTDENRVKASIDITKPARSDYLIIYPTTTTEKWKLGMSKLGSNTILKRF